MLPALTLAQSAPVDAAAVHAERIATASAAKAWIAVLAAGLLLFELLPLGRERRVSRAVGVGLVLLTLASLLAWWHPYRGSLDAWLHEKDAWHYYVGGKYFSELGYTRLYPCTVVADSESGLDRSLARAQIRDLETNEPQLATDALRNPHACKRHFAPERWRAFRHDTDWFRARVSPTQWRRFRGDHGYNPPPSWTLVGAALARTAPASDLQLALLTSLDPLLLLAGFGMLAWGFGWRIACIGFLFFSTNQLASWDWIGGSLLRFDWLASLLAALALAKRGHPMAAGALLAWPLGVRLFPVVVAAAVLGGALLDALRSRTWPPEGLRFGTGLLAGATALLLLSSLVVGPSAWGVFVENSRTHLGTQSVNRVGLGPLLSFGPASRLAETVDPNRFDRFARWRDAREATLDSRRTVHGAVVVGYLALLSLALARNPLWARAALGLAALPFLIPLGSYYYAALTGLACLVARRRDLGPALLLLAAASWWVGSWGGPDRDAVSASWSALLLALCGYETARMAWERQR